MVAIARLFLVAALGIGQSTAFVTQPWGQTNKFKSFLVKSSEGNWDGGVSANTGEDGKIKGCTITRVGSSLTEWTIQIDGEQADLGKFSEVVYKKLMIDAKQQRFQGFRPGTVPPHIEPTYRAFAMDEVAREAALEAMEQNNFRPFEDARSDLEITNVAIPPPAKKKKKKKRKKRARR